MVFPTNNGEPTSAPPCVISAMSQTWEKKMWQPRDTQAGLWKVSELAVALRSFISWLATGLPLLWDPRGLYPKFYILGFSQQVCSIVTVNPISLLFSISSHSILSLDSNLCPISASTHSGLASMGASVPSKNLTSWGHFLRHPKTRLDLLVSYSNCVLHLLLISYTHCVLHLLRCHILNTSWTLVSLSRADKGMFLIPYHVSNPWKNCTGPCKGRISNLWFCF